MGNRMFEKIALAVTMAGMAANEAPAQGTADQVEIVKSRVTALAQSLPTSFSGARTVLKGDMTLLEDGMSENEAALIEAHAITLLKNSPAEAQALIDALNRTGTIANEQQADAANNTKKTPTELAEEKKKQKALSDFMEQLNSSLKNSKKWTFKNLDVKGGGIYEISFKPEKGSSETTGVATYYIEELPPGEYLITLSAEGESDVTFWTLDDMGKVIEKITLKNGDNSVSIPENCNRVGTGTKVSSISGKLKLKSLTISRADTIVASKK